MQNGPTFHVVLTSNNYNRTTYHKRVRLNRLFRSAPVLQRDGDENRTEIVFSLNGETISSIEVTEFQISILIITELIPFVHFCREFIVHFFHSSFRDPQNISQRANVLVSRKLARKRS